MILVFKTTVNSNQKASKIKPYIDRLSPIQNWNFDLEDCDNILRIDSSANIAELVIAEVKKLGFDCEELH